MQPAGRWHADGDGPCQYVADTPDGAWAEFLRHEEITDQDDLAGIARRLWAVELPEDVDDAVDIRLPSRVARGDRDSYARCQAYAQTLRRRGPTALHAPSAALVPGAAGGQVVDSGLRDAPAANGAVWAFFGRRPEMRGWVCVDAGAPDEDLLERVNYFGTA